MRLYEFADLLRYECLKDLVMVKKDGEYIRKCRVEDLPHMPSTRRHPRAQWADEHIEAIHMEAIHTEGTLSPRYAIIIELTSETYDPVVGYTKGKGKGEGECL